MPLLCLKGPGVHPAEVLGTLLLCFVGAVIERSFPHCSSHSACGAGMCIYTCKYVGIYKYMNIIRMYVCVYINLYHVVMKACPLDVGTYYVDISKHTADRFPGLHKTVNSIARTSFK